MVSCLVPRDILDDTLFDAMCGMIEERLLFTKKEENEGVFAVGSVVAFKNSA